MNFRLNRYSVAPRRAAQSTLSNGRFTFPMPKSSIAQKPKRSPVLAIFKKK